MSVASIVLFCADAGRTARFYAALGAAFEEERHDAGPVHFAVELDDVHFALYDAGGDPVVAEHRAAGEVFVGFYVPSLDAAVEAITALGHPPVSPHEQMPWGCRVLVVDPDGRTVELNDREHCPASESG